ncbi:SDR family oxidoreductase [Pontibacter anaerobius]|uniref:SDR family oxidoreductase n=1 Tax=Pontibacter anaerobius TaxID=2993940 RepID=UPI003F70EECC
MAFFSRLPKSVPGSTSKAKEALAFQMHPIGRLGAPGEVAELLAWLSSEKASFVTGAYYAVDGAYLAQ